VVSHFAAPVIPDTKQRRQRALAPGEVSELRQPNVRLTDLQREQLVAAYAEGAFLKDLAAKFVIDVQTVKRQLKQAGVQLRAWPALSDEQIDRLVQDYTETEIPMAKLAEHYGVGYGTVRRVFEARGVQARPRGRRSRS
jgi:transposase-like protein